MADPGYIVDGVLTDGEAWVGITTTTLGSDTASVTFTSTDDGQVGDFSQYMDLVVVSYARGAVAVVTADLNMQLNADTGSNYGYQTLYGTGSAAAAASSTLAWFQLGTLPCDNATANIFMGAVTTLFDINSGKYKAALSQGACDLDGSTSGRVHLRGLTWLSQAPITQIKLYDASGAGDLADGSSFSLFGVLPRMVVA